MLTVNPVFILIRESYLKGRNRMNNGSVFERTLLPPFDMRKPNYLLRVHYRREVIVGC